MSVACGFECVVLIGFSRWAWKRCTYVGSNDSETWPTATPEEFEAVPRICRLIMAVYEPDLRNPQFGPEGGYRINPDWVLKRVVYEQTGGRSPPYLIYVDHDLKEIVLAIRGLNLVQNSDYKLLLDNRLGMQMFDGGYVHHGLLKSAIWLLNQESETLKRVWEETGKDYSMVFAGHSLGSGVAALLTIVVVNHRDKLGGIPRNKVKCYSIAPARCMSLNLAVRYADVINSIVLQDDFLPRTPTPLEDIFRSVFCLPCLMLLVCLRDTFIPEDKYLRDPRRLYAPGRMYHIVERKFCRCGRFPPQVRTAIPVDGRFEHIVLSCTATADHGILWIEKESEKALMMMRESEPEPGPKVPPKVQKFERLKTIEKEHKNALERAASLDIPYVSVEEEEPPVEKPSNEGKEKTPQEEGEDGAKSNPRRSSASKNWDELVKKLFKGDSGKVLKEEETKNPQ